MHSRHSGLSAGAASNCCFFVGQYEPQRGAGSAKLQILVITREGTGARLPLGVIRRHEVVGELCPLHPGNRTSLGTFLMSPECHEATSRYGRRFPLHQVIGQLRDSATRTIASAGSGVAAPSCQVGAAAYSLRGISRDTNCRPSMPSASNGTATGRPNQPQNQL
jgi:hypothetical protein